MADGGHPAYVCETCHDPNPLWRLTRVGEVVITWSCNAHLHDVLLGLQRLVGFNVTEVKVQYIPRLAEMAELRARLAQTESRFREEQR